MNSAASHNIRSEEFHNELKSEARALHRSVFNADIPQEVSEKYMRAHDYYLLEATEKDLLWMKRTLQRGLDLEALEFALRIIKKKHILVKKIKILVYISESFCAYYSTFVNERPQRGKAFALLSYHLIRSAYKFLKGSFLLLLLRYRYLKN
ncbi:hypothetical protein ACFLQZ_02400 [Acidobacteriota bacterium]